MENAIFIWPWEYAPQPYKDLSLNFGDEDWVAFVPDKIYNEEPHLRFLECYHFGEIVVAYKVNAGYVIISSHA